MNAKAASFGYREVDAADKPALVRAVFDKVAPRYDLMNDVMSAGLHRLWKDAAAARVNPQPSEIVVDCAGGTGDMARRLAAMAGSARRRRGGAEANIVVVDANPSMVEAGRARRGDAGILWAVGDAENLPLAGGSVDAVCIAFGLRNVTDPAVALAEMRRTLRPGGRFVCLEFSRPQNPVVARAYDAYSFRLIPSLGAALARDRAAYTYLVESIRRFPDQAALAELMRQARFANVSVTNFSGGVCALHQGWAI
jgi:demethylmenaquinone methyltransferase/2-methoxy-6-polyprenyl-1,4-benzoquinol methylase